MVRLDHRGLAPAVNVAAAGLASIVLGILLWTFDDTDPVVDLGGEE